MEEEDDLPFSTEELQAIDDMNEGGYMRGYAEAGMVVLCLVLKVAIHRWLASLDHRV
jgi:hypothetical protein